MVSRTDVHRPWFVQISDPYNRHLLYTYGWQRAVAAVRNIGCGCRLCTAHWQRKQLHRAERTRWKKDRARLLRDPEALVFKPSRRW